VNDAHVPVRQATRADAGVLARLLTDFNTEYGDDVPPVDVLASRFAQRLEGPAFLGFLVGEPVCGFGTVSLRPSIYYDGPVALLEDLYVAPARRSQGDGSELMSVLLAHARESGWSAIEIQVDERDVDAMRFYERHGFVWRDEASGDRALLWWREV
jgi:GNAT superfamily N-acetyltransferase